MLAEIFMLRLETRHRQAISQEGSSHGNSGQSPGAADLTQVHVDQ